jgi:hypothetical protein
MLFSCGYGQQRINSNKKCRRIAGDFDCHGNAAVQRWVHRSMEDIQGFTRSHWMPQSIKCLRSIAPAAAMVDDFGRNHKVLPKNYFSHRRRHGISTTGA